MSDTSAFGRFFGLHYRRMFSVGVKYENSRSGIDKNDVIFKNDNSTLEIMYDVNDWTCPPPPARVDVERFQLRSNINYLYTYVVV